MQFMQTHTIKAIGDEIHRQAMNHRIDREEAEERAGPAPRLPEAIGVQFLTQTVSTGGNRALAPSDKAAA